MKEITIVLLKLLIRLWLAHLIIVIITFIKDKLFFFALGHPLDESIIDYIITCLFQFIKKKIHNAPKLLTTTDVDTSLIDIKEGEGSVKVITEQDFEAEKAAYNSRITARGFDTYLHQLFPLN